MPEAHDCEPFLEGVLHERLRVIHNVAAEKGDAHGAS